MVFLCDVKLFSIAWTKWSCYKIKASCNKVVIANCNRLYRMLIKLTKFHSTSLSFGPSMVRFVMCCKITTFPGTCKRLGDFSFSAVPQRHCLLSFLHDEKSRIRRSQRTKESRPTSTAQHTKQAPLRHVGRGPRAQPSGGLAFPHSAGFSSFSLSLFRE
jgi:hypothetical protein